MPFHPRAAESYPKPLYFSNLIDLDEHLDKNPKRWDVLRYTSRSEIAVQAASTKGRLLACHDYKGGYTESPTDLSYTFNFWSSCDTFIYFSHNRATIPPPGWITAAHRQGVKMLGTLIFESGSEEDCLRLLVGKTPSLSVQNTSPAPSIPLSPHYAKVLANLAAVCGFDGWLLNFECPLTGGSIQTHLLSAWITILRREMRILVGEHAVVNWYDSVIYTGELRWQDRLNKLNLPFFLASDTFFTNYTWPPHFPVLTTQFFFSIDHALLVDTLSSSNNLHSFNSPSSKSLQSIFVGVDVWGRGSHGGGGFDCYKAIEHVQPRDLGLSVALFGQAWTWESEQDKAGFTWEKWWAYDRALWVGPAPSPLPSSPGKSRGEEGCQHGDFKPLVSFFPHLPPPNPVEFPFWTCFCPGVGRAWFVGGKKVMEHDIVKGWTDIDKQTSLGDMIWPAPMPTWVGFGDDDEPEGATGAEEIILPEIEGELTFDDAWIGGSALRLKVKSKEFLTEEAFRCFQIPVNSLALSPRTTYIATIVYKIPSGTSEEIEVDVSCSVKVLSNIGLSGHGGERGDSIKLLDLDTAVISNMNLPINVEDASGWSSTSIKFVVPADYMGDFVASVGVQLGFMTPSGLSSYSFDVLLGQISVYQAPPDGLTAPDLRILYAEYEKESSLLHWGWGLTLTPPGPIDPTIVLPDDPTPLWVLDKAKAWQPTFLYFNIYTQIPRADGSFAEATEASFYGSTALHNGTSFLVDASVPGSKSGDNLRFHIQGVTDRGAILDLSKCCYIDIQL